MFVYYVDSLTVASADIDSLTVASVDIIAKLNELEGRISALEP